MKGKITKIIGLVIEADGPSINLGELCYINPRIDAPPLPAEVVGFRENRVLLMPLGEMQGIGPGSEVVSSQRLLQVKVGNALLGRVLDGLGNPNARFDFQIGSTLTTGSSAIAPTKKPARA